MVQADAAGMGGRETFWRNLIARYQSRLHAYCRSLRCDRSACDDLLWDVWYDAVKAEEAIAAAADPWPILKRLARNVCESRMRRWRREHPLDNDVVPEEHRDAVEEADVENALQTWADRILRSLPEKQRIAVDFRCRWGWPYWAVAAAIDASEPTARVHVARALRRLRDLVRQTPPPGPELTSLPQVNKTRSKVPSRREGAVSHSNANDGVHRMLSR